MSGCANEASDPKSGSWSSEHPTFLGNLASWAVMLSGRELDVEAIVNRLLNPTCRFLDRDFLKFGKDHRTGTCTS